MPADQLTRKLGAARDKEFVYLQAPHQSRRRREAILALGIPGVFSQREFRRFYPQGEALAHVLGFTNIDDRGQEGLELAFDDWLRGKPGAKKVIRDRRGRIVENVDLVRAAQPGKDLTLSHRPPHPVPGLSRAASARCWKPARAAVRRWCSTSPPAKCWRWPTCRRSTRTRCDGASRDAHRNRAVTDVVEPGSTMKPITVAAALEAGVITPHTLIDTNPGWMPNGRYRTTDTHNYGVLDTTGVITKSSNVGAAKIAHAAGRRRRSTTSCAASVTADSRTADSRAKRPACCRRPTRWSGTSKQTMSYGYGLTVTPLQIAQAYAALGQRRRS